VRVIPLLVELEDFVEDHRLLGTLTADATEPAWNGYRLTVACACSVVCSTGGSRRGTPSTT
jgi:hypothetical protein